MATRDTGGQQKATRTREETDEVEASVDTEVAERHKEMGEDVDALLDEIDEVLEENAEEFVRSVRTKRGPIDHSVNQRNGMVDQVCPDCGELSSRTRVHAERSVAGRACVLLP